MRYGRQWGYTGAAVIGGLALLVPLRVGLSVSELPAEAASVGEDLRPKDRLRAAPIPILMTTHIEGVDGPVVDWPRSDPAPKVVPLEIVKRQEPGSVKQESKDVCRPGRTEWFRYRRQLRWRCVY